MKFRHRLVLGTLLSCMVCLSPALSQPRADPKAWTPVLLDGSPSSRLLVSYCSGAHCKAAELTFPELRITPVVAPVGMTYAVYDGSDQRVFFSWNRESETTTVARNEKTVAVIPHLVINPRYCGETLYYFTTTGVPKVPGGSRTRSRAGFSYLMAWRDGVTRRVVEEIFLTQAGVNICGSGNLVVKGATSGIFDSQTSLTANEVLLIDLSTGAAQPILYAGIRHPSNPVKINGWEVVQGESPGTGVFATVSGEKVKAWSVPPDYPSAHYSVAVGDRYIAGLARRYLPGLIPMNESGIRVLDTMLGTWRVAHMEELLEAAK